MPEDYSDYKKEELEELYTELSGKLEELDHDTIAFEELQEEVWAIEDEIQFREDDEMLEVEAEIQAEQESEDDEP